MIEGTLWGKLGYVVGDELIRLFVNGHFLDEDFGLGKVDELFGEERFRFGDFVKTVKYGCLLYTQGGN